METIIKLWDFLNKNPALTPLFILFSWVIIWIIFKLKVEPMENALKNLFKTVSNIKEQLLYKRIITPSGDLIQSGSPKKIMPEGYEVLNKYNVDQFINDKVKFVGQEDNETKTFMELLSFVRNNEDAKLKVHEIYYNTNIPKSICEELLALAIRDKIIDKKTK